MDCGDTKVFSYAYKMPVDVFGRTDANNPTRVISGGITSSQVNNTFLRRDGENTVTGDINFDSHKLINVSDPTNDQDVVTKKFMLDRVSLPSKKYLAPYATDTNTWAWRYFQAIQPGIPESEFDDLPAGFYGCYTSYLPASRLGNLPSSSKGYLIAITYQQPADRHKYYKWINSTNGDEWEAYFKRGTWNTWVKSSKVSKTGDVMTGNLSLSVETDHLRTLGCSDLSGTQGFDILLGSILNQIQCKLNQPITIQTTDGLLCRCAGNDVIRLGFSSPDERIGVYQDIVMNQNYIADLHHPDSDNDAVNKIYVDALGYMTAYPTMTADTTIVDRLVYVSSASSVHGDNHLSYFAFTNTVIGGKSTGWAAMTNVNEWIQMKYPFPISMSGFNIIARNIIGRNITSWKVQASNDGVRFTDIVLTNSTVFNAGELDKFTFSASAKYTYWRFFVVSAIGSEVGIGMLQWIPTLSDRYLKKCHVGYVPRLTSNVNYRGFAPIASTQKSPGFIAAFAFKGDYASGTGANGEWCTSNSINTNFWIKIGCPARIRTWKFGFRGRDGNTERIYNWRIEGSNDDANWVILYTAPNPTYLGNTYQEFLVDSVGNFQYYRLYCLRAEGTSPGLSTMQIFVYDE